MSEVRIGRRSDTTDGVWQPINAVRLPNTSTTTCWTMVRDGAGHVSNVAPLSLKLTPSSLLDMTAKKHVDGERELKSALVLERELAAWADDNGVSFEGP